MTQQDRELLRKVAERARQSGVRQSGGVSEADKQEIAHLVRPDSFVYKVMENIANMSEAELEAWRRLSRERGKTSRP